MFFSPKKVMENSIKKMCFLLKPSLMKQLFYKSSSLLKFREEFHPEILNQKVCRLLLSVHKKCSRLAVLGELGRYPVLIPALKLCFKYQHHINNIDKTSFIYKATIDM